MSLHMSHLINWHSQKSLIHRKEYWCIMKHACCIISSMTCTHQYIQKQKRKSSYLLQLRAFTTYFRTACNYFCIILIYKRQKQKRKSSYIQLRAFTPYFRTACNYFCINGKKNCESQNIHIKRKEKDKKKTRSKISNLSI